ncbi:MAG: GNAT family N-acetyltransferase [Lachnospiraceae bacterium]|nr:GNAT family N-acetyltransferase [Lachnospiraceae bacterium]
MVRLRPLKRQDAEKILPWLEDERVMALWCAGIFQYPLTKEQLISRLKQSEERTDEWAMAGVDEQGEVVGHLYMWPDFQKESLHLGMIVVDSKRRGQGLGHLLLEKAAAYAFEVLGVCQVTLGVFDCNLRALSCYEKAGFAVDYVEKDAFEYQKEHWNRIHMVRKRADRCPIST